LNVAHSYHNLAMICTGLNDRGRAKSLYKRALKIYDNQLGRTHPSTAEITRRLAELAALKGRRSKALDLLEQAESRAQAAKQQECGWCQQMARDAQKCSRCKSAWYCNETCQFKAWKQHKKHCHAAPDKPDRFLSSAAGDPAADPATEADGADDADLPVLVPLSSSSSVSASASSHKAAPDLEKSGHSVARAVAAEAAIDPAPLSANDTDDTDLPVLESLSLSSSTSASSRARVSV
jgi:hypothetical protein